MTDIAALDLDDVIECQHFRPYTLGLLAVAALALVSDGFDLSAIGYVGPELVKQWHISATALVPVFSAGIIGLLLGAPLLGFIGDRFGRKRAILTGLMVFGGATLVTALASSVSQLIVLRFVTGLGLGGVIPNIIALTGEIAPKRVRGMFMVLVNFGIPLGIATPGFVAAGLVPRFGWPALPLVGGLLPLVVGAIGYVVLPESLKYLATHGKRQAEIVRYARALRPDLAIASDTRFFVAAPPSATTHSAGSVKGLFSAGLAAITPLLWVALAANQMANFFTLTWLPTLLQSTGSSTAQAGVSASLFAIGGLLGGVFQTLLIDRLGVIPMVLLFVLGTPLIAAIGLSGLTPVEHVAIIAGAGFCVTGINFGMTAALGLLYPTAVRSAGIGWAHAAGRIGALAAPVVGGALLRLNAPVFDLLLAPAAVLGVGALACLALAALCVRRFSGTRLGEFAVARPLVQSFGSPLEVER